MLLRYSFLIYSNSNNNNILLLIIIIINININNSTDNNSISIVSPFLTNSYYSLTIVLLYSFENKVPSSPPRLRRWRDAPDSAGGGAQG